MVEWSLRQSEYVDPLTDFEVLLQFCWLAIRAVKELRVL
jgi:hypothetical protein